MLEPTSRYYGVREAHLDVGEERMVIYKRRRFIPQTEETSWYSSIAVDYRDRLDHIAHRTLGNPELFWLICDANEAMNPRELIDSSSGVLRLPASPPAETV